MKKRPTEPIERMHRLKVDETPVKKANTVIVHIRVDKSLDDDFRERGAQLGIPYTTLMRRVLEAYQEQVLAEFKVIKV